MEPPDGDESFNPYSVVHLVFHHLAAHGLHPTLGAAGDPGVPAAQLLRALGVRPSADGDRQAVEGVHQHLADLRAVFFEDP
jgi:hypothetical protein